jgi:hypothetical protein
MAERRERECVVVCEVELATISPVLEVAEAVCGPGEEMLACHQTGPRALVGRERTSTGIRFRCRVERDIEAWVRDLAAREKACCAFSSPDISTVGDEAHWDMAVTDHELARTILEEFYALPIALDEGLDTLRGHFTAQGLDIIEDPRRTPGC